MKSLVLIRCPLMRRKRYFGVFKSRRKVLGKLFLDNVQESFTRNSTFIHSSSFSKAQAAAKVLCETYSIDDERMLNVNPNLQDLDMEGCFQLLRQTSNHIDTVVLIAPGVTVSSLFAHLQGERKIFASGSAEMVEFNLEDWALVKSDTFDESSIREVRTA